MRYIVTHKQNRAMRRQAARLAGLPMVRYVHENKSLNILDTDSYKLHNPNLKFEDEELHIDPELKENLDALKKLK